MSHPARSCRHASAVLGWCSPFASGRVLEEVYQAALAGASPAQALRALAGDQVFAEWARARAYDAVHGGSADSVIDAVHRWRQRGSVDDADDLTIVIVDVTG